MRFLFWALLLLFLLWGFLRFRRFLRGIRALFDRQYQERAAYQGIRREKDISDRVRIIDEQQYSEDRNGEKEHGQGRNDPGEPGEPGEHKEPQDHKEDKRSGPAPSRWQE